MNIFRRTLAQRLDKFLKKYPNLEWVNVSYVAKKVKCSDEELTKEIESRGYEKAIILELPCGGILDREPFGIDEVIPEDFYDYCSCATYRTEDLKRVEVYVSA